MSCTVKDFLNSIDWLKQHGHEDIENYQLFIENPNYFAPENGKSIDQAIEDIDNCAYDVIYYSEDDCWTLITPDGLQYYKTKEDAEKDIPECKRAFEEIKQDYLKTKRYMENMQKAGWEPWYDNQGWVHIDVASPECHFTADKENKKLSLNSNY